MSQNTHEIDHIEAEIESSKFSSGMLISIGISILLVAFVWALHEVFGG